MLGVNGAEVCIFEETPEVSTAGLLESNRLRALESGADFPDESLAGRFPGQELGAPPVSSDFSKRDEYYRIKVEFFPAAVGALLLATLVCLLKVCLSESCLLGTS